jgi:hypothetical protein
MTHDPDDDPLNFDIPDDEPSRAEAMSDDEIDERIAASGARIQDGTIKDAGDFWQLIQDVYIMEGENRAYERRKLRWLDECLQKFLAAHPEIYTARDPDGRMPLENFAIESTARLVHAFVFNDGIGADDPDFRQRTFDQITGALGPAAEGAMMIEHKLAEDVLDAIAHGRALDPELVGLIISPDRMASVGLALIRAILKNHAS